MSAGEGIFRKHSGPIFPRESGSASLVRRFFLGPAIPDLTWIKSKACRVSSVRPRCALSRVRLKINGPPASSMVAGYPEIFLQAMDMER